jgi:hypothetical protein
MVFIDCRITERKGRSPALTKLMVHEEELLINVVKKAIGKFLNINHDNSEEVDNAFNRLKDVSCNGCSLIDFTIDDPSATLIAMDSSDTRIFTKGIDLVLSPIETDEEEGATGKGTKKAKVVDAHKVLMKQIQLKMHFLKPKEVNIDTEKYINDQILDKIYEVFEEIELGYSSNDQKVKLEGNAVLLMRSLCFVQKYWKVLFRADYPHIPTGAEDFASSKLFTALIDGLTRNNKNE